MITLIVGLGNPGPQYDFTPHNIGFDYLDYLAKQFSTSFSFSKKFNAETADFMTDGHKYILLKPQTFMNLSGVSVGAAMKFYKPEYLIVVHDELDLDEGQTKFKFGGSDAGHRGIRSIHQHLSSKNFYRLKLGIGHPRRQNSQIPVEKYVLGKIKDYQSIYQTYSDFMPEALLQRIIANNPDKS